MDWFSYRDGRLFAEDVDVADIAESVGTPVYIYSKATFKGHLKKIQTAYRQLETMICYSVKACSNINILRFMAEAGSGFDIVSAGELYRVLQAGGEPSKIVYAGVGKTSDEILEALKHQIAYFNTESEAELKNLIHLAAGSGQTTRAALRVNPDIDYQTHKYITTGKKENKFGVDIEKAVEIFDKYADNGSVSLCAVHIHLGSGGKSIDPYVNAIKKILPLIERLREKGHHIQALNLGGGYGADYQSGTSASADDYAAGIVPLLKDKDLKLILEPGKSICANAGILLTRVLYTKGSGEKKFVIVDAGMNDLIRPPLYNAFHFVWPTDVEEQFAVAKRDENLNIDGSEVVDVVGPICESADFLAKDRALPPVKQGDLISVFTAGAYGFTMSSNYNSRPRAAEVLVEGNSFSVIRKRETFEDMIRLEK